MNGPRFIQVTRVDQRGTIYFNPAKLLYLTEGRIQGDECTILVFGEGTKVGVMEPLAEVLAECREMERLRPLVPLFNDEESE